MIPQLFYRALRRIPLSASVATVSHRFYSTPGGGPGAEEDTPAADETLLDEVDTLVAAPVPIGTLFKSLSGESRSVLMQKKMAMEMFLLKHPTRYTVFRMPDDGRIMAARCDAVPEGALRGKERSSEKLFEGSITQTQHNIYTILKYIPNEWSPFVNLGIPEDVKVRCMGRKAKLFFQKYPRYFEVKEQGLRAHTFEVRRSQALQRHMAAQEAAMTAAAQQRQS